VFSILTSFFSEATLPLGFFSRDEKMKRSAYNIFSKAFFLLGNVTVLIHRARPESLGKLPDGFFSA